MAWSRVSRTVAPAACVAGLAEASHAPSRSRRCWGWGPLAPNPQLSRARSSPQPSRTEIARARTRTIAPRVTDAPRRPRAGSCAHYPRDEGLDVGGGTRPRRSALLPSVHKYGHRRDRPDGEALASSGTASVLTLSIR